MQYYIYKLKFSSPVHFGNSSKKLSFSSSSMAFSSSTLFSALCNICYDNELVEKLINLSKSNKFIISDGMPYKNNDLFIPRPLFSYADLPHFQIKKLSEIDYVAVDDLSKYYIYTLNETSDFDIKNIEFGKKTLENKVNVRSSENGSNPAPYLYEVFKFYSDCGLYFIAGLENESYFEFIDKAITHLGISGIGGAISRGYGKFEISDVICLNTCPDQQMKSIYNMLEHKNANKNILISTSLPTNSELTESYQNSCFELVKLGGYFASDESFKEKDTQYFMKSGSIFRKRFEGDLYVVGNSGKHDVYRYGKSLFLGV